MEKCWERCKKVCWGKCGKVLWGVGKGEGRSRKVCWGVGKEKRSGNVEKRK